MTLPALQSYATNAANYTPRIIQTGLTNLGHAIEDSGIAHLINQEAGNPVTHALIALGFIGSLNLGKGQIKFVVKTSALTAGILLASNKEQFIIFLTTIIFTKIIQHYLSQRIKDRNTYFNSQKIIHLLDSSQKKN